MEKTKTLIIGSGPAGYTAAIYAGRANLRPVLYSGLQPGGQLTTTTLVENFPGFHEGIDANQLMNEMRQQAALYGADLRDGSIVKADLSSRPFHLEDERGNEIEAETVIIATGASAKYLGLADEEDTACEEAMYLSGLAKKVYMIVRKPYLRAAEIMRKRVTEKENIEILYNTNTIGLYGENGVEGAHLVRFKGEKNEEKYDISIDGFFLAIGHTPNTELFKGQLEMDDHGFIVTRPKSTATSVEGVYAAGDVADPTYRQGVVAAGTGAMAAIEVDRFLQKQ